MILLIWALLVELWSASLPFTPMIRVWILPATEFFCTVQWKDKNKWIRGRVGQYKKIMISSHVVVLKVLCRNKPFKLFHIELEIAHQSIILSAIVLHFAQAPKNSPELSSWDIKSSNWLPVQREVRNTKKTKNQNFLDSTRKTKNFFVFGEKIPRLWSVYEFSRTLRDSDGKRLSKVFWRFSTNIEEVQGGSDAKVNQLKLGLVLES